jgi:hypothetical protein
VNHSQWLGNIHPRETMGRGVYSKAPRPGRNFPQPLRVRGIGKVQVLWEPKTTHFSTEAKLFAMSPGHPSRAKHEAFVASFPKDTLRWQFLTRPSVRQLPKAVQREALKQKWRKVFMQALSDAGYTPEGRKYPSFEPGLFGTLEALVFAGDGWKEDEKYCRRICNAIIGAIEQRQAAAVGEARRADGSRFYSDPFMDRART